jgi:uncharacterized membrane protein
LRRKLLMKNSKLIVRVIGFVLAIALVALSADAPLLTFKFGKANVPGAMQTTPSDINNAGTSVGNYVDSAGVNHGYILSGKNVITLDDPNAEGGTTGGSGIQYNGTAVVGSYTNSAGVSVGFLYKAGKYTDIPGPSGNIGTAANSINDKSAIVGNYTDSSGVTHGFLLGGEKYTALDVPGGLGTVATSINNKGVIVLFYAVNSKGTVGGAMTSNNGKTYKKINVPKTGPAGCEALSLNNEGDISFTWFDSANLFHGALFHAGKYYKFDYPKAVQTYATGLNDNGAVIGGYQAAKNGPMAGYKAVF